MSLPPQALERGIAEEDKTSFPSFSLFFLIHKLHIKSVAKHDMWWCFLGNFDAELFNLQ